MEVVESVEAAEPPPPAPTGRRFSTSRIAYLTRYGMLAAMAATFVTFCVLSPNAFFTTITMKAILENVTPLLILSLGVTVVLVMNDFDLSIGGQVSLLGTIAVLLLSTAHVGLPYQLAIFLTILAGIGLGLFNGLLIAYAGAPSF